MVGYRATLATIVAVLVAACVAARSPSLRQAATSPTPSQPPAEVPSGSRQVAAVSPDPSPATRPTATPARTPDPLSVKEAGAALLAAKGSFETMWAAGQADKYLVSVLCNNTPSACSDAEWKSRREVWGIRAAALSAYVTRLKAIRFPAVAASAAAAYIETAVTFHDRALSASKATTLDTFNSRAASAQAVSDGTFTDNEQLLLDALGLPVGP